MFSVEIFHSKQTRLCNISFCPDHPPFKRLLRLLPAPFRRVFLVVPVGAALPGNLARTFRTAGATLLGVTRAAQISNRGGAFAKWPPRFFRRSAFVQAARPNTPLALPAGMRSRPAGRRQPAPAGGI